MLALDWAKAFDCVAPAALCTSLRRFGIPEQFVAMIRDIYSERKFIVAGAVSEPHDQHNGISQGCPLSPFLFVIIMTTLLHDAKQKLCVGQGFKLSDRFVAHEPVYADDTLLIDVTGNTFELFMKAIGEAGAEYGLAFNWSKLESLPIRCADQVIKPDGMPVKTKQSMLYLGSLLSADGRIGSEFGRRLGLAQADFRTLQKVWAHASISTSRKLLIYHACIVSTLTYGLHTAWLITAERRRLDGFHAWCIRKIIGVLPSYYSRISNRAILERARATPLSSILMRRQLQFLAHIAYRTHGDALRDAVFRPGTLHPRGFEGARARGRPRQTWTSGVLREALEAAGGSQEHLSFLLQDTPGCRRAWKNAISKHCNKAAEGSK